MESLTLSLSDNTDCNAAFGQSTYKAGLAGQEDDGHGQNEAGQQHLEVHACSVPDLNKPKETVLCDEHNICGAVPAEIHHL